MTNSVQRILVLAAILMNVFQPADAQFAMPMYMPAAVPQPVYAMPPPMAVAFQLPHQVSKTTTTTTTSAPNIAIPLPVPVPMPVQIAVPALPPPMFCQAQPQPKSCPPCPPCMCMPSCTPAFFSYCSPCHLKCRCRKPEDAPVPLPPKPPAPILGPAYPLPMPMVAAPIMGPPPVVVIPIAPSGPLPLPPALRPKPRRKHRGRPYLTSSSDSEDTSDSCDTSTGSDSGYKRSGRKFKKRRTQIYRRNAPDSDRDSDTDLVKPVLSYISENGDVKYRTKISKKDAMKILGGKRIQTSDEKQTVNIGADKNAIIVSNDGRKSGRRYDQILLRDNTVLKEGRNQLVFEPPSQKRISNITMSFQVS